MYPTCPRDLHKLEINVFRERTPTPRPRAASKGVTAIPLFAIQNKGASNLRFVVNTTHRDDDEESSDGEIDLLFTKARLLWLWESTTSRRELAAPDPLETSCLDFGPFILELTQPFVSC